VNRSSIGGTQLAFWGTGISLRSSGGSRPSDEGGPVSKNIFWPFGPPFGLNISGEGGVRRASPLDPPLRRSGIH